MQVSTDFPPPPTGDAGEEEGVKTPSNRHTLIRRCITGRNPPQFRTALFGCPLHRTFIPPAKSFRRVCSIAQLCEKHTTTKELLQAAVEMVRCNSTFALRVWNVHMSTFC